MSVVYTCSRIAVNLTQSYSPLYLTEALHFQIEAIAYFPLVMLVSGAFSSFMVKKISRRLGTKWTFFIASSIVICASSWFYLQTVSERHSAYAAAFLMGSGNSVMLVMALSMIADLIGNDKASGGFVYSFMGLLDKAVAGLAVLFIQEYYPESPPEGIREGREVVEVETMDQGTQTTENGVSDLQATDAVADISCAGV
ncbi:Major facilitator superfamily domain-containing protein 12 [Acropora cervicornis]|uniref:Major facilitator superfamily domain-containing protein 12 n=1 Tax=Acropora cervicornis TaxID=6130 RepID=A0AAD9PV28_ACRCE|nr:Major facilitator superfamily domain-containing protein 12 [Acropora cervicornis]